MTSLIFFIFLFEGKALIVFLMPREIVFVLCKCSRMSSLGGATAEDLIRSTKQLTAATARAAGAAQTLQQSDIIAVANFARQSVCDLLATTRAAALSADSVDARFFLNS